MRPCAVTRSLKKESSDEEMESKRKKQNGQRSNLVLVVWSRHGCEEIDSAALCFDL